MVEKMYAICRETRMLRLRRVESFGLCDWIPKQMHTYCLVSANELWTANLITNSVMIIKDNGYLVSPYVAPFVCAECVHYILNRLRSHVPCSLRIHVQHWFCHHWIYRRIKLDGKRIFGCFTRKLLCVCSLSAAIQTHFHFLWFFFF